MEFGDNFEPVSRETLDRAKRRAFMANYRAKCSKGLEREAHYRAKHNAINVLLEAGYASVDSVDWSQSDAIFGIQFVGGGKLHTILSSLSSGALRTVRRQLNGCLTPQPSARLHHYDQLESKATMWN